MRLRVEDIKKILDVAKEKDLDDRILVDFEREYKLILIYLNDNAWEEFERIVKECTQD